MSAKTVLFPAEFADPLFPLAGLHQGINYQQGQQANSYPGSNNYILKYYISLYVMLALYPRMRIKAFSKDNKATVFGIADILKLYYDNTYNEKLEKAIEGIIFFSFANPDEAERTSKQMIDSLYDLLQECLPHFKRITIGEFKTIVIRQTRSWIKNNRLKDGFSRSPDIYEQCFNFPLYSYINVLRKQETIKDHDDLKNEKKHL